MHDFIDKELGKAIPYGGYDIAADAGWVSAGTDADTAQFAVNTLRAWWNRVGKPAYLHASRLLITADSGGSNGSRLRLWKTEEQADVQKPQLSDGVRVLARHTIRATVAAARGRCLSQEARAVSSPRNAVA